MYKIAVLIATSEPVHEASQETAKLITGIGCIMIIVVCALFWAYKK
jgi:hypothetical protein